MKILSIILAYFLSPWQTTLVGPGKVVGPVTIPPSSAAASIAFVNSADLGNNGGSGATLTASYTVGSGTNRALFLIVGGISGGGAGNVTGCTYNGVTMTLDASDGAGGATRWIYVFRLLNPTSGAHNVVCTASSDFILALAADYTGVKQSAQPDATNICFLSTSATNPSCSVTTIANNSWSIMGLYANATVTAGTGDIFRVKGAAFGEPYIFDSNQAITPAGAYGMALTGTFAYEIVIVSFSHA